MRPGGAPTTQATAAEAYLWSFPRTLFRSWKPRGQRACRRGPSRCPGGASRWLSDAGPRMGTRPCNQLLDGQAILDRWIASAGYASLLHDRASAAAAMDAFEAPVQGTEPPGCTAWTRPDSTSSRMSQLQMRMALQEYRATSQYYWEGPTLHATTGEVSWPVPSIARQLHATGFAAIAPECASEGSGPYNSGCRIRTNRALRRLLASSRRRWPAVAMPRSIKPLSTPSASWMAGAAWRPVGRVGQRRRCRETPSRPDYPIRSIRAHRLDYRVLPGERSYRLSIVTSCSITR